MLVAATYVTDGDVTVVAPGRAPVTRHFGATMPVADRAIPSHDVVVPLDLTPDATVVVRATAPFSRPALRLEPASRIAARSDATMHAIGLPLAFLNGGALTMALYNLVLFALLRRRIYVLYAIAIAALVLFQVVQTGAAWTVLWPHLSLRDDYPPYVAWVLYVVLIAWFTREFLDLRRAAPLMIRLLHAAVIAVVVTSALYVAVPDWLVASKLYPLLDPAVTVLLLAAMLGSGVVARRAGVPGSLAYIIAFSGSALGIIVAEIATYLPETSLRELAYFPTACGVAWESIFLALALGQRVRDSEREAARLAIFAYRDGLTGIANRRAFDEAIEREWNRASRTVRPLAIILFDIDHFKRFNDRYGHPQGDACLVAVAQAVAESARREGDLAARFGGEEFVLLLPNTDGDAAFAIADEVRRRVAALHDGDDPLTISAGVATSADAPDPRALIAAADAALYAAKQGGRDRAVRAGTPVQA
jgi:diguanylate cyclase (GGDEF)-like protein